MTQATCIGSCACQLGALRRASVAHPADDKSVAQEEAGLECKATASNPGACRGGASCRRKYGLPVLGAKAIVCVARALASLPRRIMLSNTPAGTEVSSSIGWRWVGRGGPVRDDLAAWLLVDLCNPPPRKSSAKPQPLELARDTPLPRAAAVDELADVLAPTVTLGPPYKPPPKRARGGSSPPLALCMRQMSDISSSVGSGKGFISGSQSCSRTGLAERGSKSMGWHNGASNSSMVATAAAAMVWCFYGGD